MNTRVDALIAVFLSLLTLLIARTFAGIDVDDHHDGLMFKVAFDIFHGAIPFKETFTQYGLLLSLMQSWTMKILGPTVLSIRLLTVLCYGANAGLLYLVWRRFIPRNVAVVGVLVWLALAPFYLHPFLAWSSSTALPAQTAMILFTLRYLEGRQTRDLFLAGVCVGLAFWIRMPVGLLSFVTLLALLAYLPVAQKRSFRGFAKAVPPVLLLTAGTLAISSPLVLYLVLRDGLNDWYLQTFMMAIYFARTIPQAWSGSEGFLPSLFSSLFPMKVGAIWVAFPSAVLVTFGWAIARTLVSPHAAGDARVRQLLALSALCIASWAQYYPVTEDRHVFWGATPMVGVLLYLILETRAYAARLTAARWSASASYASAAVGIGALANLLAYPILGRIDGGRQRLAINSQPLSSPAVLAGLYVTPLAKALYEGMAEDLAAVQRTLPETPVINIGYDPLYLTFGEYRKNWHPLYVFFDIGVAIYPQYPTELGRFIKERQPILWTAGALPDGYKAVAHYANGISLVAPGHDTSRSLLKALADQTTSTVLLHAKVPNRFDLRTPMRVTGQRFPALGPIAQGTVEFVMRPELVESATATVLTNLYGPTPGRGIRIHKGRFEYIYQVSVGAEQGPPQSIMTFQVKPKVCNHVVVRWEMGSWQVMRDGIEVANANVAHAAVDSANQVIVNNGSSRQEYHVGLVDEIRIVSHRLDDATVRESARWAAQQCARLGRDAAP